MTELSVSVVICAYTFDRVDDLKAAVESVYQQTSPADEVIVVIDHNPDLADLIRPQLPCDVIENSSVKGLSGARNTGLKASTSEIVAFLDDDAVADRTWLEHIRASFEESEVEVVGGAAYPAWDGAAPVWFPSTFGWVIGCSYTGQPSKRTDVRNVMGCNMAFRRRAAIAAGGFHTDLGRTAKRPLGCEETELCIRINAERPETRIVFEPAAVVHHRVRRERATLRYFVQRCRAEGNSKANVAALVGQDRALESEKTYVRSVLPRALASAMGSTLRSPAKGAGSSAAILAGLGFTSVGYLEQRFSQAVDARRGDS